MDKSSAGCNQDFSLIWTSALSVYKHQDFDKTNKGLLVDKLVAPTPDKYVSLDLT